MLANHHIARFWKQVEKRGSGECWLWCGVIDGAGYGYPMFGGKRFGAHRLAYELAIGPIVGGLFVCHHCDNRRCVNPEHLFLGTVRDNARDMVAKGRDRYGPNRCPAEPIPKKGRPASKLSDDQIRAIAASDAPRIVLAKEFGVSSTTVFEIRKGHRWSHVTGIGS